jgi:aryl-alcohol dehydrogenase-like predicted oxidoreductase
MPQERLGSTGPEVSRLALGSWRTFERLGRPQGLAVMHAARDAGITFLDDARYNDETGTAPIPSGYSEVLFGELFAAAGWPRETTTVANKLWWEFWPAETADQEIDGSLRRMGLEHIDLIYAEAPRDGLSVEQIVEQVSGVIAAGKARWWGLLNWPPVTVAEVATVVARNGAPAPVAAQLPYSLVQREPVESKAMTDALSACGASVVASYTMAGGVLTGKYDDDPAAGRAAGTLDHPRTAPAVSAGHELALLARSVGIDPGTLAVAFALDNPTVASVLFGATGPEQIERNVAAIDVAASLDETLRERLQAIGR